MMRFAGLALVVALGIAAVPAQAWSREPAPVPTISAQKLKAVLSENRPMFLLDVRQPDEFRAGHLDNAVLIPLGELEKRHTEIPRDKKIVVYCRSGRGSALAAEFLRRQGFKDVESLEGGILEWEKTQRK